MQFIWLMTMGHVSLHIQHCEMSIPKAGPGELTGSWGEPALETLRFKHILQQQMYGLALHSCEKVRENLCYAKWIYCFLL